MLGGIFSHKGLPDGKTRKGSYTVKIVDTASPITRGLKDFPLKDELYYHIQMEPGVEPLATIRHDDQDWPVAWTRTFGKGRVFHTPLGHRDFGPGKDDPLHDANMAKLLMQGIDWSPSPEPCVGGIADSMWEIGDSRLEIGVGDTSLELEIGDWRLKMRGRRGSEVHTAEACLASRFPI